MTSGKILAVALSLLSVQGFAQLVEISSTQRIQTPISVWEAALSPDGTFAIAASNNDDSLWQIPLSNASKTRKVADNGIMYGLQFAEDGNNLIYIKEITTPQRLRYKEVECVNLSTLEGNMVHPASRTLNGVAAVGAEAVVIDNARKAAYSLGKSENGRLKAANAALSKRPVASIRYGQLMLTIGDETKALNPNGKEGCSYLWPSVSPDGTMVLYYLVGSGTFVCNLDGKILAHIGRLHDPCWLGNDMIVGMNDYDDGESITSSEVKVANLKGEIQTLTPDNIIALYPTASADGSKILFSTPTGELHVINLKK